jgi:opacity protein-like surface antigen
MLTKMKKRSALLVTLAVLCASVAVAPQMASAQSKVHNAGTATDPHTAPN